jgi:hypothetical protein
MRSTRSHVISTSARGYDIQIRRFLPCYDVMIATGVELYAAPAPADRHLLDLGGGMGALLAGVPDGLLGVCVPVLQRD